MATREKNELIQPPNIVDKQLESYSYTDWAGKIQEQYRKIKENAETYPYVWGSYIDRVRVLQDRLCKLVQAEGSPSSSITKAPSSCDKSTK
ncbi:unnamed protein product [Withania somnifera]